MPNSVVFQVADFHVWQNIKKKAEVFHWVLQKKVSCDVTQTIDFSPRQIQNPIRGSCDLLQRYDSYPNTEVQSKFGVFVLYMSIYTSSTTFAD